MTTCIGNAHIDHHCADTASSPPLRSHDHHDTAPGPQIGTILQLGSSYAGRNNRNKISYESAFFSYARVPILRYEFNPEYSAVSAQSSPAQLQMTSGTPFLPSLHRNKNPKLFQSWNRNKKGPVKTAIHPEPSHCRYESPAFYGPFPGKTGTSIPSCFKAAIGTRKTPPKQPHSPNRPISDTDRQRCPALSGQKSERQAQAVSKPPSEQSLLPMQPCHHAQEKMPRKI